MFLRIFRIILAVIAALLVVFLQFSFVSNFSPFFRGINLPLISILLSLIFFGSRGALVASLSFGFFLDSWHFSAFGIYLLTFLSVVLVAQLILNNWLTDRSLFSFLALTMISSLVYQIIWSFLNLLFSFGSDGNSIFFLFSLGFIIQTLYLVFWSVLVCGFSFIILSLVDNRLKPVFLKKR
ncbi:MAG: hypothetical protein ACOYMB_00805 [Patescibacteria group bacterium]